MTEVDEICTVRSFSLYVRQIRWLEMNASNRSELIRELIDDHIDSLEGYAVAIDELNTRSIELREEIQRNEDKMSVLIAKQEEFMRDRVGEREERIRVLRDELSVG